MSRSKFEEWAEVEGYNIERDEIGYVYSETIDAYRGWLAGRESMRSEALNACENEHLEDPQDSQDEAYENAVIHCKRAIKKIKL